jgi:GNAT superfamily N-acetyltransferase
MTAEVTLRPAAEADGDFLRRVYASSRSMEMAAVPWTGEEQAEFLRGQYELQDRHYRTAYEGAEFSIVVINGHDAGRLIVHRGPKVTEIMDLTLLEAFRGRGIGSGIIRGLMDEAARTGNSLRLWVEQFNPARRLYDRMGFIRAGDHGIHMEFVWNAAQPNTAS